MKLISIFFIFITTMFFNSNKLFSQSRIWLNPGIKLGYIFSENGGFTYGFEVSLTGEGSKSALYGIVLDINYWNGRKKIHLGAQGSSTSTSVGLSVGPTWILENGETDIGLSVTPFIGLYLFPYYEYTSRKEKTSIKEIGLYLKYPLQINGKPWEIR